MAGGDVVLPPDVDKDGFWDAHFGDCVGEVCPGKSCFISPEVDRRETRTFLHLADIRPVAHRTVVDFMTASANKDKDAKWWYECYSYLAEHQKTSLMSHEDFAECRLLPTRESGIIAVQKDADRVVCLPPADDTSHIGVPGCFSPVFVFLDPSLAELIRKGEDKVRTWVQDHFHIAAFEATDLIPKAVRAVGPNIFKGTLSVTSSSLVEAWTFLYRITKSSREIKSPDFWNELGRFPLPVKQDEADSSLRPDTLIPAFLAYWPDTFDDEHSCLSGVRGLRRLDEDFVQTLLVDTEGHKEDWAVFLKKVGVSSAPKLLTFHRKSGQDLELSPGGPKKFQGLSFTGNRKRDENIAVAQVLCHGQLWESVLSKTKCRKHDEAEVLEQVTLLEGFSNCIEKARQEFDEADDRWKERLDRLAQELPINSIEELPEDLLHRRGGPLNRHDLPAGSCLRRQLRYSRWLPSSQGPASGSTCFLRQSSRRFISAGREDELGDKLLPYVVVPDSKEAERLQQLGVEVLEDAPSASISVLIRALVSLGEALKAEWGEKEILKVRSRWRLVRGAMQEAYRCLNRVEEEEALDFPSSMKWPVRSKEGTRFESSPVYYAEPGSAVEQAFIDVLPLLDVDTPYPKLFRSAGIVQLEPGKTIEERFLGESVSQPLESIRDEIVESLSPYLLAPLVARVEQPKHIDLVVRRMKERFQVRISPTLEVSFLFDAEHKYERTVPFPYFYLQTQKIQLESTIQVRQYVLYIAASSPVTMMELDSDALGGVLVPVFFNDISNKNLEGLFPRIASRFKETRGDHPKMKEFMHRHLSISDDAMDMARAKITGEFAEASPVPSPPPTIVSTPGISTWSQPDNVKKQVEDSFKSTAGQLSNYLVTPRTGKGSGSSGGSSIGRGFSGSQYDEPTPEQQRRGKNGEEEIKRRLELPGGWADLKLVADRREDGCGYDFLCDRNGQEVKLEIKTFSRDGRVIVTTEELHQAATSGDKYCLLGVLDDGGSPTEWRTMFIQNPFSTLLKKGKLAIKAKLEAPASAIFGF